MFRVFLVLVIIVVLIYISLWQKDVNAIAYVLHHDQRSRNTASMFQKYRWAKYHKLGKSKYFESAFWPVLMNRHFEWSDKKYVGMISYSIVNKQNITKFPMEQIISDSRNADVVTFYKFSGDGMIAHAYRFHKHFKRAWTALLMRMGYKENDILSPKIPLYPCNCWMAKPNWMRSFLQFAERARYIMENDSDVRKLCYMNSDYPGRLRKSELMEISGKPYYTLHPFIMERLPCFYFWMHAAKVYDVNIGVPNFYY